MKIIITEEQNLKLSFLRRMEDIITHLKNTYTYLYPCDYDNINSFMYSLKRDFLDSYVADWLHSDNEDDLWKLIIDIHGKKIKEEYFETCKRFNYE